MLYTITMVSSSLRCAMLLSALCAPVIALELVRAQEFPQVSRRQQGFLGGWGLGISGTECPSDVPVLCTGSIKNPGCCPSSTFCFGSSSTYCCPTDTDCKNPVINFPKCADANWTLYIGVLYSDSFFCCPTGQFGVHPLNSKYGSLCVVDGEPIAGTRLATKAATVRATVVVTSRTVDTLTVTTISNGRPLTLTTTVTNRLTLTDTIAPFSDATGSNTGAATTKNTDTTNLLSQATNAPTSSSALGTGAIVGIVIGGLGVLALFLVAFLLYRRRKPAAAAVPATDYTTYAPPTHQQQPDMGVYPTQVKSPAISNAGTATVVGSPGLEHVQPQQQQQHAFEHYGPPPPAAGYSEVQGQNTWNGPGRAEIGPGR